MAKKDQKKEFIEAGSEPEGNIISELIGFMAENKKWWLLPIFVVVLILGMIVFLGGTGAAPFIYTLF
tara:strand:- start:2101 stop:2301 length:201 start_codon:yes stop_codon:yes gene_type:complete